MAVCFSAGRFSAKTDLIFSGDSLMKMRAAIGTSGDEFIISHDEIKDLQYVLERMACAMRAALPGDKRHEMT